MAADPKGFAAILIFLGALGPMRFRVTIVSE